MGSASQKDRWHCPTAVCWSSKIAAGRLSRVAPGRCGIGCCGDRRRAERRRHRTGRSVLPLQQWRHGLPHAGWHASAGSRAGRRPDWVDRGRRSARAATSKSCTANAMDSRCARRTIWSSTPTAGCGSPTMARAGSTAAIRVVFFYAKTDGSSIRQLVRYMDGPNGIGLSPDGKTLYAAETPTGRVWGIRRDRAGRDFEGAGPPHPGRAGGCWPIRTGTTCSIHWPSTAAAISASGRSPATFRSSRRTARRAKTWRCPTRSRPTSASAAPDLKTAYITLSGAGPSDRHGVAASRLAAEFLELIDGYVT